MLLPVESAPGSVEDLESRLRAMPEALVSGGRFNLGVFRAPFRHVNPLDARIGLIPRPRGIKNLLLREWEHYGLANRRFFVSVALFDPKRIGVAQVVVYDRQNKTTVVHERLVRSHALEIPDDVWGSVARASTAQMRIEARHNLDEGTHRIEFLCRRDKRRPDVQGVFICEEDLNVVEPLVVCLPLRWRRAMYSHKAVLPLQGELRIGRDTFVFSRDESFALPDIHKGYYPYITKWHWAMGGGKDRLGRFIGFNLTNNQVKDQKTHNENCLWINGKVHRLPPVRFSMNSRDMERPWHIRDAEGRVDVKFRPESMRSVYKNLLIWCSKYRGPYGSFSGRILDDDGNEVSVDRCYGLAEDFYLRS